MTHKEHIGMEKSHRMDKGVGQKPEDHGATRGQCRVAAA